MQNFFIVMRAHKICSLKNIQVYHVDNYITLTLMGFPSNSVSKESEFFTWLNPWVRKISWRRKRQPTPVLVPGKFHGGRNLIGYSPWGRRVRHDRVTSLSLFSLFLGPCHHTPSSPTLRHRVRAQYAWRSV